MMRILSLIVAVLVAAIAVAILPAPENASEPIVLATPTKTLPTSENASERASESLPACTHEDGSGQMLCMWDASESGNGVGTDVVSGDCSPMTVGSNAASELCVRVWVLDARSVELSNGARADYPNGEALVAECLDIEWEASRDKDMRNELNNDGWNMSECFKAYL